MYRVHYIPYLLYTQSNTSRFHFLYGREHPFNLNVPYPTGQKIKIIFYSA